MGLSSSNTNNGPTAMYTTSNYFPKGGYTVLPPPLNPVVRAILCGVYDDNNSLSKFRGMRYLIQAIWQYVGTNPVQYPPETISKYFDITGTAVNWYNGLRSPYFHRLDRIKHCSGDLSYLQFPKPLKEEININMMPIRMDQTLPQQLPANLQGYIPYIYACIRCDETQKGTICYLTIHESFVEKGKSQRRPGLHVELPGNIVGTMGKPHFAAWGGGFQQRDGIYMATSVDETCAVYDCGVIADGKEGVMDKMGGLEHLRQMLPMDRKRLLKKNILHWITDKTPHEALAMKEDGWRQFFRLVSHKLSV